MTRYPGRKAAPYRCRPLDERTFYPLTFTDRIVRVFVMPKHGTEKRRYRYRAKQIALNPDPRTTGELLLRAIKEGA